ncbi:MAG TPA: hypothetical protein VN829_03060 [Dongiaceae bacterium]|nr:hypothetical protein [Dongiaceae bacterium]
MKLTIKGAGNRSDFMAATLLPVHRIERDARFRALEAVLALAFIFGVVALMRLALAFLADRPPWH